MGKNEILCIVGESGCGKTITTHSILGLLPKSVEKKINGKINYKDENLLNFTEKKFRKIRGNEISMIFQEPTTSLNPSMKVGKQISEVIKLHSNIKNKEIKKEVITILNNVNIYDPERVYEEYPHNLSGGMKQRIMIGIALACNPKILIADEPTTALDVTIQKQILLIIKRLKDNFNISIIFITHDMGVVAEIADKVIVMLEGEIVEYNDVNKIFFEPVHDYTKLLIESVPQLGSMKGKSFPEKFFITNEKNKNNKDLKDNNFNLNSSSKEILKIEKLVKIYKTNKNYFTLNKNANITAINKISFDINCGETFSIVGESGCGKTTLAKLIVNLTEPTNGSIYFKGDNITNKDKYRKKFKKEIQIIFQDPYSTLNPKLKIGHALRESVLFHKIVNKNHAKKYIIDILKKVGLDSHHYDQYPKSFSGGQRQRICIARALCPNPSLIIADEAVSSLDVTIRAQIINLMMDIQKEFGVTYLFISHDMAVVERISHRVAVMCFGKIVEIGSRKHIFENPIHPYTKELLNSVPIANPKTKNNNNTIKYGNNYKTDDFFKNDIMKEVNPGHYVLI